MFSPIQRFRDAWRGLRGSPVLSAVAVATLAVGIGANSVVFAALKATVLTPPAVLEPDRVLSLTEIDPAFPDRRYGVSLPAYRDWESGLEGLADLAALIGGEYVVSGPGDPQRVQVALVSASFFQVTGRRPVMGRDFTASEDRPGAEPVAVASHAFWRTYFGGDPGAVGTTFRFGGHPITLIGVLPAGFDVPADASLYVPLNVFAAARWHDERRAHIANVLARIKPGRSAEEVRLALESVHSRAATADPGADPGHQTWVRTLQQATTGDLARPLELLQLSALALLLIACVNLAGVLLTRTQSRAREWALRRALGATATDIVALALSECVLLAGLGAVTSAAVSGWLIPLFASLVPDPRLAQLKSDPAVFFLGIVLALLVGVATGVLPAIAALRESRGGIAVSSVRQIGLAPGGRRVQGILLSGQVAAALTLLVGAGLLVGSLREVLNADAGFETSKLLTFRVAPPPDRYDEPSDVVRFFSGVADSLRALPGVTDVGAVSTLPVSGPGSKGEVTIEASQVAPDQKPTSGYLRVLPGYFRAIGIPLLRGRDFSERDDGRGEPVVIVTESLAARLWPGQDPIGRRVKVGPPDGEPWLRVVGVSGDWRQARVDGTSEYQTFEPLSQRPRGVMRFAIRSASSPEALVRPATAAIRALEPAVVIDQVQTMDARIGESLRPRKLQTTLLAVFALLAVAITALGIYAVGASAVEQRTKEIGLRVALGAGPRRILRFALGQGLKPVAVGLVLGAGGAAGFAMALRGLLFGLDPLRADIHVAAILTLALVALAASAVPARRAVRLSPTEALRQE